jgi:conjugal transfer pilin signal peptidase TrbI
MTEQNKAKRSDTPLIVAISVILPLVAIYQYGMPVSLGYDPHEDRCLPDVHLSLLVHHRPAEINDGDMVFFDKPPGVFDWVKEKYIMKVVGGVPGDHITIKEGEVKINGKTIVSGFPLAVTYYHKPIEYYEKDEKIPPGKIFMIGYSKLSDDSRYWGYLDKNLIRGQAYKIF